MDNHRLSFSAGTHHPHLRLSQASLRDAHAVYDGHHQLSCRHHPVSMVAKLLCAARRTPAAGRRHRHRPALNVQHHPGAGSRRTPRLHDWRSLAHHRHGACSRPFARRPDCQLFWLAYDFRQPAALPATFRSTGHQKHPSGRHAGAGGTLQPAAVSFAHHRLQQPHLCYNAGLLARLAA